MNQKHNAMKCPFCSDLRLIPVAREDVAEHLVMTIGKDSRYHVHGPIRDEKLIREMILKIAKEAKIDVEDEEDTRIKGEIVKGERVAGHYGEGAKGSSEGCKLYDE